MENSSLSNRLLDERKRKIEDVSSSSECTFQGSPEQMREIVEIINKTVKTELDKATERITESIKSTFLHRLEILEGQIFTVQSRCESQDIQIKVITEQHANIQSQLQDKDSVIGNLDQTVANLSNTIHKLQLSINDNAPYTRKNTCRIFGIHEQANENTM